MSNISVIVNDSNNITAVVDQGVIGPQGPIGPPGPGDVDGPASATDNAVARFDGTTGKLIQNSVVTIGDTGNIAGVGTLAVTDLTDSSLTSGRVTYAGTGGNLVDSANLTFNGTDLTVAGAVNAGSINATTLDLTNLEVTNIKAKDGTASITLADSTGVASFTANPVLSGGTANGVAYLNGSKVLTTGSALTFDGTALGLNNNGYLTFGGALALYGDTDQTVIRGRATNGILFQDSTAAEQMRLTSTGLGIGTSSPAVKLDVNGSGRFKGFDSGYYNENVLAFGNASYDPKIGMASITGYRWNMRIADVGASSAGNFVIRYEEGSLDTLTIDRSGNLGLGVTPSSTIWSGDETRLVVKGNGASKAGVLGLQSQGTTNATTAFFVAEDLRAGASLGTSTNSFLAFQTNGTERARIDSSGNLGIGTSSPGSFDSFANNLVVGTGSGSEGITIYGGSTDSSNLSFADGTGAASYQGFIQYNHAADSLGFWVNYSGSSSPRLTIDSSGNLGLGVTPSAWGSGKGFEIGAVGNGVWAGGGYLNLMQNTAFTSGAYRYVATSTAARYEIEGNVFKWLTAPSGTAGNAITFTQAMSLTAAGDLLVGTTDNTVTNGAFVLQGSGSINSYLKLGHKNGSNSGADFVAFYYNGTQIGGVAQSGTTAVSYNTSSDYRLKNISGPVANSGTYIDSLKPVQGSWKADGSVFVGLLAHEAQEVSRTSVATGEKDGAEMQAMDYGNSEFIANIIAELQSLRKRVAELEAK